MKRILFILLSLFGGCSVAIAQTSVLNGTSTSKLAPDQTSNSGKFLTTDGTNTSWTALPSIVGASYQATPANPTGSSDLTGLMMGLAGSITPAVSGSVLIIISGYGDNNAGGDDGGKVKIRYGTGSAPTNGAALTGTGAGNMPQYRYDGGTMNGDFPFSCSALVTGLSVGTAYWIDLSLASLSGGTSNVYSLSISVIEVPNGYPVPWYYTSTITADQTAVVNYEYRANKVTTCNITLPATCAVGDRLKVVQMDSHGWRVKNAGASGKIYFGGSTSTTGTTGGIQSVGAHDCIELECVAANNEWTVTTSTGIPATY